MDTQADPSLPRVHMPFSFLTLSGLLYLSCVMRKPAFYICENKDADQVCGKLTA